ncbi:MAG: Hpt domain-containing protein, partial [Gemmatimonadales bacterium]|nr:Hpt domain-containing protein [Gemmatimonadales bacterium]
MTDASRRAGFFVLEAEEYLSELQPYLTVGPGPAGERGLRTVRALRGAAVMAGLDSYARATAELERLIRLIQQGTLDWTPDTQSGWRDALAVLRSLVGHAATWEAADDRTALRLASQIEALAGGAPTEIATPPEPAGPAALTPGVRAFLARETGLIAGALEGAATAHLSFPPVDALQAVRQRMQALRGLGSAVALSPLPELLDAMELITRSLLTDAPPPPGIGEMLADAAAAMARMAKTIGSSGVVESPPELESLGRRFLKGYAAEDDVVPIGELAPDGQDSLALAGRPPLALPTTAPVPGEMIGVGDHLLAQAEALAAPRSTAARDLRLFVLHRTLADMPTRGGTGRFLAPLIAGGDALEHPEVLDAMLRDCGEFLTTTGREASAAELDAGRDRLLARMIGGGMGGAPDQVDPLIGTPIIPISALAPESTVAVDESDIVDINSLAPDAVADNDIVDITSLAPDAVDDSDIVDITSLAPDAVDDSDIVDITSLAPDAVDDSDIVDITSLAPDVIDRPPPRHSRL